MTSTPNKWSPLMSLPNELLLNCVARLSRLYYPTLSLVCKSFGALLASPELYKTRSLLGQTEICLYVFIWYGSGRRWYTLCRKPDKFLDDTKSKASGYVLARVPIPDSTTDFDFEGLVAVGSSIYHIDTIFSSDVSVLDCRSHTWREASSFPVKLWSCSASVVDEKIYVAGRYRDGDGDDEPLVNLFKVLDPKTEIWDSLPPTHSTGDYYVYGTSCIDGKFQVVTSSQVDLAYSSKEGRWDLFRSEMNKYMFGNSYCVIENVLYSAAFHGNFRWYDYEVHEWKNLNGLDGLPKLGPFDRRIGLAGYGVGKMMVFWKEKMPSGLFGSVRCHTKIWCAEISLERRSEGIWGKVEWFDPVLTSRMNFNLIKVLAPTL